MGGEGSMMHAIKSLKNNRNLLKERKRKSKMDVYGKPSTTELVFKKSTQDDVLRVRKEMRAYNKRLMIKGFMVFGVLVLGIVILWFFLG